MTTTTEWATARGDKWRDQLGGMEGMLAPVTAPLVEALALDGAPCRVADLGCGGGATTFAIHARAPAGSVVHGLDISPALVAAARARVPAGDATIAFALVDVATMPRPDVRYDRIASRFGVMFYDDPAAAFANVARCAAPGARLAVAVWAPIADNPWQRVPREVTATIVDVPAADPAAPGPFRYADPAPLIDVLARAGVAELAVRDWRGALPIGGGLPAPDAARFSLAASAFGDLLARAGGDALDRARDALAARFAPHERDGAVRMDARVHIVTGTLGAAR